ncbi:MAG: hypothetical protein PWP08_1121 [Methanofollis sp.]|nr:hypothetical protein [Methanofollis sp.]
MTLPKGKNFGSMNAPIEEVLPFTEAFYSVVRMRTGSGEGFVLLDKGDPIAAGFHDGSQDLLGESALSFLSDEPSPACMLFRYDPDEYLKAIDWCREMGYEISTEAGQAPARDEERMPEETSAPVLTDEALNLILSQPGVIAVSAFFEGFAVQSAGAADFDRIAAVAEDLLRAGSKIAGDMETGDLDQIILETPGGKLIIAPFGDLSLCILTAANANLGLVRLALRSIRWSE